METWKTFGICMIASQLVPVPRRPVTQGEGFKGGMQDEKAGAQQSELQLGEEALVGASPERQPPSGCPSPSHLQAAFPLHVPAFQAAVSDLERSPTSFPQAPLLEDNLNQELGWGGE